MATVPATGDPLGVTAPCRTASNGIEISTLPPVDIEADLFVIGPEGPLVADLAGKLRGQGKLVLGPGADGAMLEGSKVFMKELLQEARVPTARFATFGEDEEAAALAWLDSLEPPYVVKTDGLASGKGVLVTWDIGEAAADVRAKLSGDAFGDAGRRIVIEEGLIGSELSLMVLCDGRRVVPFQAARDYKRVADGDAGPNTGGMGSYSPLGEVSHRLVDRVMDEAVEPLVGALRRRGIDYRGVLYAGLMLTDDGPRVLEYNVRFGDPEAQVLLALLAEDAVALFSEAAHGRLRLEPKFQTASAVCVVLAAKGYPSAPQAGARIQGLAEAAELDGVTVLHAGTATEEGDFVVDGGRVLNVVATGPTREGARERAYRGVAAIGFDGMHFRTDLAAGVPPELAGEDGPAVARRGIDG